MLCMANELQSTIFDCKEEFLIGFNEFAIKISLLPRDSRLGQDQEKFIERCIYGKDNLLNKLEDKLRTRKAESEFTPDDIKLLCLITRVLPAFKYVHRLKVLAETLEQQVKMNDQEASSSLAAPSTTYPEHRVSLSFDYSHETTTDTLSYDSPRLEELAGDGYTEEDRADSARHLLSVIDINKKPDSFEGLSSDELRLLALDRLLTLYPERTYFKGTYSLKVGKGQSLEITINNLIVKRQCAGQRHQGQIRYEIVAPQPIDSGAEGEVYKVLATIVPVMEQVGSYNETRVAAIRQYTRKGHHQRVAKLRLIHGSDMGHAFTDSAHEVCMMNKSGASLSAKQPAKLSGLGVVVFMRYISGMTLLDHVNNLNDGKKINPQVISLVMLLLVDAYKKQAFDQGLCHRDLKLENVMIDGHIITFLDWAYSTYIKKNDLRTNMGSPVYASPEACWEQKVSTPADIYAIGVIMNILFLLMKNKLGDMHMARHHKYSSSDLKAFFPEHSSASSSRSRRRTSGSHEKGKAKRERQDLTPKQLASFFNRLCSKEPDSRPSVDECFTTFQTLNQRLSART